MGRPETELRCKKHPQHRQTPGVCSYCLRDRLSQLSSSQNIATISSYCSSLSSSSSYSSASSYSSSPIHHHRFASDVSGPISFLISGKNGFMKSRSIAFVPRNRHEENGWNGKKKRGFWSKLFSSTSKRTKEVLIHSKTLRERETARVY